MSNLDYENVVDAMRSASRTRKCHNCHGKLEEKFFSIAHHDITVLYGNSFLFYCKPCFISYIGTEDLARDLNAYVSDEDY